MSLSGDDLREILRTIWSTQLGLELDLGKPEVEILRDRKASMTGVVQISGGFSGALHLTCLRPVIERAAAKMFSLPPADLREDDLRDALGELTNMVAGNVKTLLPGSERISLPTVVEGTDYGVVRLESDVVAAATAHIDDEAMTAVLFRDRE